MMSGATCAPRSISAPTIAACWSRAGAGRRLPRHRRLLAHRAAGRGAGGERVPVRAGDGAHARRRSGSAPARSRAAARARARYVATEACRRAANCAEFLDRVRRDTGIPIEIISSDEEARLVVAGCAPLLDPARAARPGLRHRRRLDRARLARPARDAAPAPRIRGLRLGAAWRRDPGRPLWRARGDAPRPTTRWSRRCAAALAPFEERHAHRAAHRRGRRCRCSAAPAR